MLFSFFDEVECEPFLVKADSEDLAYKIAKTYFTEPYLRNDSYLDKSNLTIFEGVDIYGRSNSCC